MHPPDYYAALRKPWAPTQPRLIVIAESPPKTGKYFYDATGRPTEALFSALMESLVGGSKPESKEVGLQAFQANGFLLLDATYTPVDDRREGKGRNKVVEDNFLKLLAYLDKADPSRRAQLLLIKANVCRILEPRLLQKGGRRMVNNKVVVPFPSNGHQVRFKTIVAKMNLCSGF